MALFKSEIHERRARLEARRRALLEQREALEAEEIELRLELARIETLEYADERVQHESATTNSSETVEEPLDSRRMRLGAQKRAIYELIAQNPYGLNVEMTADISRQWNIEAKYVRDMIRQGVSDDYIDMDEDGDLSLTVHGSELLERAPLPRDWDQYAPRFRTNNVRARNGGRNGPPERGGYNPPYGTQARQRSRVG